MMEKVDVFISGGGLAGLFAAAAFGQAGFSVVLADPHNPSEGDDDGQTDLRTTAYLRPARDLIERTGLWPALAPSATPLQTLRIVDTVGWPPEIRDTKDFQADELGDEPFGWNLPNATARTSVIQATSSLPSVSLRFGAGFAGLVQRESEALVTVSDGTRLRARLAIAADGRASPLREAAGIGSDIQRYGQKALAFVVTHELPHDCTSTELYNSGGAFTLVPMADIDGKPASAVVWMNDGRFAADLMAMDSATFENTASVRSCGVLGSLKLVSKRQIWPVVTQRARNLTAQRVALIAEAAHVLPPIGAQGLNTSLKDVALLASLAEAEPDRLGDAAMLDSYARSRARDISARARAIDLFNRICMSGDTPVLGLRLAGLRAVHGIAPLRKVVMRAGLGN